MAEPLAAPGQPLLGFMSNEEWDALIFELNERVERMEALPEGDTKRQVFELLNDIDTMHREGLRRLVRLFKAGVLEQVVTDPAIHTLMELYDLLPEAVAPAKPPFPTIPIRAVRAAPPPAPLRYPHWVPVPGPALLRSSAPAGGGVSEALDIDGQPLLLVRREQEWFALAAQCPVDGSPLRGASLSGYTLSCPNHGGCHYDVRSGARIGGGAGIACHPVKTDEQGRVLVGLDMDFKPALPSF